MKNKHFLCLLLGLCICVSGCSFGSTAQTDAPPAQEQKDEGKTTEIIVPGGKEDKTEEDKKKECDSHEENYYKKYRTDVCEQDALYLLKANAPINTEAHSNVQA